MAIDMARAEVIPKIIADRAVVAPLFRAANNTGADAS